MASNYPILPRRLPSSRKASTEDTFDGGIGAFDGCHSFWLNIAPSNKSYKQLIWQFDQKVTTTWSASPGQSIATGETTKFLACQVKGIWFLYLQTGTDQPPGELCYVTQLQVSTVLPSAP
ncbi:hypothetical protein FRB94_000977 [Tulasnella sp. JGI-2019a]|nr:hypothetical protein FRB93_006308 [Tulasnella sp. JGI-2019a]KAG8988239.1 hypothetical protein FRB94_000977 [Tulasnella sp. JGI-2019a]